MATKRVIGNNQYGFNPTGLVLPNELPGGDGPNVKNIIQTPQTNDTGAIIGGNGKVTASNSIDNTDVYSYKSISGVNQTTGGSNISTSSAGNTPSNVTSNTSSGGFLPTGSSATGTGNNNMLNKKSIKKRMLSIPGQEQTTQQDIIGATEIIPQQSQATSEQYGVNRDAVDQVNANNKTGVGYNKVPLPGETVKPTDTPTGDFQTDFQRQSQIEARDAIQGGEFMNQQDKGIQEGGLAYIKNITDKYNEGLAKMQSDSDYEQKMFEMKAEDAKINHEADIEEIQREAQKQIAQAEFMGARTGAGQASGYVQGVQNIAMDAQRTISRLNDSFARATARNKLTAKKNLEDYTLQLKQAKDDWNYQTRNISQQAEQNYNAVMQGAMEAGLDPAKIEKSLYNLASSVVESRNKALGSYIDNTRKVTDNINAQIEGASKLQDMSDKQRAQFTSIINANGGDAIAGLSNKSIDEYVQQGYLSPAEAVAYKTAGLQMAVSTLQKLGSTTTRDGKIVQQGIVSSEDVKKIQEYVDQGFTYAEAVATVASEDPTRFNKAPIEQPLSALDRVKLQSAQNDLNTIDWKDSGSVDDNGNKIWFDPKTGKTMTPGTMPNTTTTTTGQVKLGETPIDTGIKNVYGSNVKLAPTVAKMVTNAIGILAGQGINLKIADSYRSHETQAQSYASGKAGVAPPGKSFHELGQAFDLSQKGSDKMNDPKVFEALKEAGLQQLPGERRHWSYGEMGDGSSSTKYSDAITNQAKNILNGVGSYPSKNDKNYNKVVNAVGDQLNEKLNSTNDEQLKTLYNSSKYSKELDATAIKSLTDVKTVVTQLDSLTKNLTKEETGPIIGFLKGKNPYDVDAQSITAQINALAPKVARGVFGEVGVLTDQDIERYLKTIPNLKQTKELGSVVGDLLKVGVYKSFINTITTNAQAGRNMANFIPDYEKAVKYLDSKGISSQPFDQSTQSNNAQISSGTNRGRKK